MSELRHQAQETFHRNPGGNPFSSENDKPEEKGNQKQNYFVCTVIFKKELFVGKIINSYFEQ